MSCDSIRAFLVRAMLLAAVALQWPPTAWAADDPDARPPVTRGDLQIVRDAQRVLDSPAHWNRADNRQCPAAATTFSLYCALEKATRAAGREFEHRGAALQETRFVIDEITADRDYDHRLMDYNNDARTTFADVKQVLHIAEELIALRLEGAPAGVPPH